ncbi:MAG: c-type cytochrome [Betaproteobacteria bacterium]|nr:c-type cytochrome [Betaproteobacteria bacterium]
MIKTRKGWALAAGILAVSTTALAAPPSAEMLSNACAGCHGTNGGSAGLTMPSLAGQSKEAIVDAMKKYKSGERKSTIMGRLAKGYSDAQIVAMGEFFSKKKIHATNQTLDPVKVAKGASLQEANCSRCHLEEGREGKDDTPAMASQWLPYLQIQMNQYLTDQRKMPEKMAEKVKPLSKADLDALLHYYASVK